MSSPGLQSRPSKREKAKQWIAHRMDGIRSGLTSPSASQPSTSAQAGWPQGDMLASSLETDSIPYHDRTSSSANQPKDDVSYPAQVRKARSGNNPRQDYIEPLLPTIIEPSASFPVQRSSSSADECTPAHYYGPVNNIERADNAFTGVNYGTVVQNSSDESNWLDFLPQRLKISLKADYGYYPGRDENALRRSSCTPGTRVSVIGGVVDWAVNESPDSESVFWLSGQAGAGKSTIAYTIAVEFASRISTTDCKAMLGGSFFCSRHSPETRTASAIVRTIVYRLALRSKAFRAALKAYGDFEMVDRAPRSQLEALLTIPWEKSYPERLAKQEPSYIIPIDALDELDAAGGTEFLAALFDIVGRLRGLKFFITSRSDPALVARIKSFKEKQVCRLEEVPVEESSADIALYLKENLGDCASEEEIERLVVDAAGLFIYAATVVDYVKGRSLGEQRSILRRLLGLSRPSAHQSARGVTTMLDALYLQILETSLVDPRDRDDLDLPSQCLAILHTILCTVERSSSSVVAGLLNATDDDGGPTFDPGVADSVVARLHAVLYTQDGQVLWFHKSFADFLFDKERSQRFYCNQEQRHRVLVNGCFRVMNSQLRFNIADIPTSHQLDRHNPSLLASVNNNISEVLRYACRWWSNHLGFVAPATANAIIGVINQFLQIRTLFWIETMSLLSQRGRCDVMLREAREWIAKSNNLPDELMQDVTDATAFALYFSSSRAALSTPHLYLSALATFPRNSGLLRRWRHQFQGIPVFTNASGTTSTALLSTFLAGGRVTSVAYSPDGTHVAAGSEDHLVRVWDLSTGEEKVFHGHTGWVTAVTYSPDGTRIVSGSWDSSVRVWEASTGEQLWVLQGHSGWVTSVACSPDGIHVASGSHDQLVRVWDMVNGAEMKVYKGHTSRVTLVGFLSDSKHIVSGSTSQWVHVRNLFEEEEPRMFKLQSEWANPLAFSPNRKYIASGSQSLGNNTVKVHDLYMGQPPTVLSGHTGGVTSVAFSPDSTQLVPGSLDKSVRAWTLSPAEELKLLNGHRAKVTSVAYSSDGKRVVSGSYDSSVRVWDLSVKEEEEAAFKGHTGWVTSVAYTLDGTRAISGSYDNSVRVWDLVTGEELRVMQGHSGWVSSVAFSPFGTSAVSGSFDSNIIIWDLFTGEKWNVLKGHGNAVTSVTYALGGTRIFSSSYDTSIRIWDAVTGEALNVFMGHTSWVTSVACSPDSTSLPGKLDFDNVEMRVKMLPKMLPVLKGFPPHQNVTCSQR